MGRLTNLYPKHLFVCPQKAWGTYGKLGFLVGDTSKQDLCSIYKVQIIQTH